MEYVDVALKIITGPWDIITWIIALILGASVIGGVYRIIAGKTFGNASTEYDGIEEFNDSMTKPYTDSSYQNMPGNIWNSN